MFYMIHVQPVVPTKCCVLLKSANAFCVNSLVLSLVPALLFQTRA